jgi:predicted RNA-binding protein with PUA-like domain
MAEAPNYWLIKSEPYKYSFAELVRDKSTMWEGVRNFEARNNLRSMRKGDLALFYHSNEGKAVVGIACVSREAYPDPTAPGEDWSVVEVVPISSLKQPVPLELIKSDESLAEMALLKRSRLSVVPVTRPEFDRVLALGKTSLRGRGARGAKKASVKKPPASTAATSATKAEAARGSKAGAAAKKAKIVSKKMDVA